MKRTLTSIIVISSIILITSTANAQLFSIGVGGGLTQITGPSSLTDDVSSLGMGYSTEYNLGVIAKLGLPIIPITPRGFILYHKLNGSGEPPNSSNPKGNTLSNGTVEYSQSILQIGLGAQVDFIPVPVGFSPYFSFDLTYNSFGDLNVEGSPDNSPREISDSKYGLQVGLGTEVTIIPVINLDITANYGWFNLIGKDTGEETVTAFTVDAFIMFSFL